MDEKDLAHLLRNNPQITVYGYEGPSQSPMPQPKAKTTAQAQPMTGPEAEFAATYLEPRLNEGYYFWWAHQLEQRDLGQTYTWDFIAQRSQDGGLDFFEVKGKEKLGSEDRASVKVRWATSIQQHPLNQCFWVKKRRETWAIRRITLKREEAKLVKEYRESQKKRPQ